MTQSAQSIPPDPYARPATPASLSIVSIMSIVFCSDGKFRCVVLEGKRGRQIKGFIEHIQGGKIKLLDEPMLIISEKDFIANVKAKSVAPVPAPEPAPATEAALPPVVADANV